MVRRFLVGTVLATLSALALAQGTNARTLHFAPNQTLSVRLSATNVNRISVAHDAITYALCPQRFCQVVVNHDDPSGGVYVSLLQPMPFTLQLTSRSGQHVALQVIPQQGVGRTLVLKGRLPATNNPLLKKASYATQLSALTQAMITQRQLAGFYQIKLTHPKAKRFYRVGRISLQSTWQGEQLTGLAYWLENRTHKPLTLSPSTFYRGQVAAVALGRQVVPAHQGTWVYVIQANEDTQS